MQKAFRALKRAISSRKDDENFVVDSQWILEGDFGACRPTYRLRNDENGREFNDGNNRNKPDVGKRKSPAVRTKDDLQTKHQDSGRTGMTNDAQELPFDVKEATSTSWDASNPTLVFANTSNGIYNRGMKERTGNIQGILAGLQEDIIASGSVIPSNRIRGSTGKSEDSESVSDGTEESDSERTSDDDPYSESVSSRSSDSDTESEYDPPTRITEESELEKDDCQEAQEYSGRHCLDTIHKNENDLDSQQESHISATESAHEEDGQIEDKSKERTVEHGPDAKNEVLTSKIRSIRQMWMEKEKEEGTGPLVIVKCCGTVANKCNEFKATNRTETLVKTGESVTNREIPVNSTTTKTCEENLNTTTIKHAPELQQNMHSDEVLENGMHGTRDPDKNLAEVPSIGVVQRMAMKMQLQDEEVHMREEMIANHQPVGKSPSCDGNGLPAAKFSNASETDDSFLLYLLEIGRQDEKKDCIKHKKHFSFFDMKTSDRRLGRTKEESAVEKQKNFKVEKKEHKQFLDNSVTDPYFCQILTTKSVPDDVKIKLKEEFFSIFNNSKTPRGIKKSLLDNLILQFTQTS